MKSISANLVQTMFGKRVNERRTSDEQERRTARQTNERKWWKQRKGITWNFLFRKLSIGHSTASHSNSLALVWSLFREHCGMLSWLAVSLQRLSWRTDECARIRSSQSGFTSDGRRTPIMNRVLDVIRGRSSWVGNLPDLVGHIVRQHFTGLLTGLVIGKIRLPCGRGESRHGESQLTAIAGSRWKPILEKAKFDYWWPFAQLQ